jgi:hypothetical protein
MDGRKLVPEEGEELESLGTGRVIVVTPIARETRKIKPSSIGSWTR